MRFASLGVFRGICLVRLPSRHYHVCSAGFSLFFLRAARGPNASCKTYGNRFRCRLDPLGSKGKICFDMVYWPACFEHLATAEHISGTLSVWHIRAFMTGVQTGILHLGFDPLPSAELLRRFKEYLRNHYGDAPDEFEAVARQSARRKISATTLIHDWSEFWSHLPSSDTLAK